MVARKRRIRTTRLPPELQSLFKLHGRGLFLKVVGPHDAVHGVLFDLDAVADQEEERDEVEYHQAHGPEPNARIHGQSHQGLGHACGIGVDHTAGKAYGGGEQDHGGPHHLVIAQGDKQRDDDGVEGIQRVQIADDAQAHEQSEKQHDHDQALAICLFNQGLDTRGERAGHLDDLDAAADEQHAADDVGTLHKALVQRGEEPQERHRRLFHVSEAAGIHRAVHAGIAAGGDQVGHDRDQQHQDQDDRVHVGHAEAFFLFQCVAHHFTSSNNSMS